MTYRSQVQAAAAALQDRFGDAPAVAVVLGSGLGAFAEAIEQPSGCDTALIPFWPASTAPGHQGRLVAGTVGGVPIIAQQGRVHYYESGDMKQVTFPVRAFGLWGVKKLIITNASGGVDLSLKPGDLVLVDDHINFMGNNPLIGANDSDWGPRFPDMTKCYSEKLCRAVEQVAADAQLSLRRGTYMAFSGPSYETPAEIRLARALGATVVGMSSVPEAIVARHMGMDVTCISCVANMAAGVTGNELTEQEVLDRMNLTGKELSNLLLSLVALL